MNDRPTVHPVQIDDEPTAPRKVWLPWPVFVKGEPLEIEVEGRRITVLFDRHESSVACVRRRPV